MSEKPPKPDLPKYVLDPLDRQDPNELEAVADYARRLATWKRQQKAVAAQERAKTESVSDSLRRRLKDQGHETNPENVNGVKDWAYLTIKTTKKTDEKEYRFFYWQWYDPDKDDWGYKYVAPVEDDPTADE